MDDSCAVCAESMEWVAYGACGHKDVCSTCVARLRFICDDRRCCICKTDCDVVFVTKALGDYTKIINDFTVFPKEAKEGRVGQYWYHEDTQAFFDDSDHYKMIKAMCRLSCSVCDSKQEDQPGDGPRRRVKFRNIEQLKGHLFHRHKLVMCSLCLEGRKVFICEQKLYTRSQLTQHINTGNSEVDGDESERGGFTGHPMCEFCYTPFYGDNELYTHMSTEHYTCHICQRQHPGQYEYYKNYDDLEIHFRGVHFLCEHAGCLEKKFIVFQSETELKRHNTLEHGGNMSRSQRSAALQIPTSFRYRRSNEQDNHRGRGHFFRRDNVENELSMAIQASLETASALASSAQGVFDNGNTTDVESLTPAVESLGTTDSEHSSRYRQVVSASSISGTLEESSFPPLSVASVSNQQNPDVRPKNTMAARFRGQSNNRKVNVVSKASGWPEANRTPALSAITPHAWPPVNGVSGSSSSGSGQSRPIATSSHSTSSQTRPQLASSGSASGITHSSSSSNLSVHVLHSSDADFPPVSALQTRKPPSTDQVAVTKVEDVHTANKSLVEQMRAALGSDDDKFTAFKGISSEYRQGSMDVETYLAHVEQFGLSHLVLDLARLLPNSQKQKELIDAHNRFTLSKNALAENSDIRKHVKKGKGKSIESGSSSAAGNNLADNIINTMKELQASYKTSDGEVEVLSKDRYRTNTGKSKVVAHNQPAELRRPGESSIITSNAETLSSGNGSNQSKGDGNGKVKQKKKTPKFLRVRLGDGSMEAPLDLNNGDYEPDPGPAVKETEPTGASDASGSLPARGVWGRGGGQKLFATASRGPKGRV